MLVRLFIVLFPWQCTVIIVYYPLSLGERTLDFWFDRGKDCFSGWGKGNQGEPDNADRIRGENPSQDISITLHKFFTNIAPNLATRRKCFIWSLQNF